MVVAEVCCTHLVPAFTKNEASSDRHFDSLAVHPEGRPSKPLSYTKCLSMAPSAGMYPAHTSDRGHNARKVPDASLKDSG